MFVTNADSTKTKTLTYIQDDVHDFAWFADKEYKIKKKMFLLKIKAMLVVIFFTEMKTRTLGKMPQNILQQLCFIIQNF